MNRIPANSELCAWSLGRAGWTSLPPVERLGDGAITSGEAPVSSIVILETGDQSVQVRLVEHFALLEGGANTEGG